MAGSAAETPVALPPPQLAPVPSSSDSLPSVMTPATSSALQQGSFGGVGAPAAAPPDAQAPYGDGGVHAAPAVRAAKEFDLVASGGGLGVLDDRRRLARPRAPLFNLPESGRAEAVFRGLCYVADAHLAWVVRRAVEASFSAPAAVADPELQARRTSQWSNALLTLARRAVAGVDPNVRAGDRADVRVYIKVKAVPSLLDEGGPVAGAGGAAQLRVGTCEVINGVAFRRSLAHKQMRQDIPFPRVMLLNGGGRFARAS